MAIVLVLATAPTLLAGPHPAQAHPQPVITAAEPVSFDAGVAELAVAREKVFARPSRDTPRTTPQPVQENPATERQPESSSGGSGRSVPDSKLPAIPQGAAGAVVEYALAQRGKPYRYATAGPNSFDCSGLALAAYATVGITIPHQTGGIVKRGQAVTRGELQPGDLVFPSSGHVGIYLGGNLMVHAPKPGDHVRVAEIYSFWTARRLL